MSKHEDKTNAIRQVEKDGFPFKLHEVKADGSMSGLEVAHLAGENPDSVFKTLVTESKHGQYYVFMIPVACELDMKKAAKACGEKAVRMVKSKELLGLTGYVHGGCSPIGMKKQFPTYIDETAQIYDSICFSAGRIGQQIEMSAEHLSEMIPLQYADLIVI